MAVETLNTAEGTTVVPEVAVVPEAENVEATPAVVCEKEESPEKVLGSASFKEETNVAGELPDLQKKALDELKQLVQEALNKHEFTSPVKEETPEKEDKATTIVEEEAKACVDSAGNVEASTPPAPAEEKTTTVVEDEAKACNDSVGNVESVPPPAPEEATPPEEVSIWGIPLLADERSDVVLLKFLRARDFKVKEALTMLKSVVTWRKQFGIESLLEEDLGREQEQVVYMQGVDKEGHPVCYNAYGEYQNKELYNETFSTEEKRTKFLRWRIQFLEKSIRKLDFSPNGICTILQVIDFKNSPGPFKRELRQATNQALQLFQDNYPEFVAKQVFINVPFIYLAFYKLINPFLTQRTKSKFVFAGPSKTAETLFKYITPELVPVQYGGLSRNGDQDFTSGDSVTEEIIKPSTKHTIEFPAVEACTLVWEARVMGNEVAYGAEFVPACADGYTVIVQKSRKPAATTDEPVISGQFKCEEPGKVVLTFDNLTSKKKKVVMYRSKTKVTESIKC
ncbi:hypothetical protein QVD17_02465 [Tagetes erecta]|uniref:Uncharacterized protein n=1 Tax=Tagetes erecta TaxID=13708 RepID=A0AAD8P7T2_TARER|nr:hypothetical protein QVD17_02465 [Tagetes erecta]